MAHYDTAASLLQAVGIRTCSAVASLTLSLAFAGGNASIGRMQALLNLELLKTVPSHSLRRIQVCIIADEKGSDGDVGMQAEQVRRMLAKEVLARFNRLEKVVIVVRDGYGGKESDIWREIEGLLREAMPEGVKLAQGDDLLM